jgi:uncharacterized membrane protein YqhA
MARAQGRAYSSRCPGYSLAGMGRAPSEIRASRGRSTSLGLVLAVRDYWRYLPLAIAGTYLIVLLTQFQAIVRTIYQNADAAAPLQLAKLLSAHSGTLVLGQSPWYSTLLFGRATRGIPFYRILWDLTPFIVTAISFAAVVWATWRVAGRWAATITFSLLVCASAPLLYQFGILNNHVLTWYSDSLLIAGLVWVLYPARPIPRSRWLPVAVLLGLLVALNLASDPLLYAGGIVPVLAGAVFTWRRSSTVRTFDGVLYALTTTGVAIVGSLLVVHFMRQHHIISDPGFVITFAPTGALSEHFGLWWQTIAILGGNFYSRTVTLVPIIYFAAAALTVAAVVLIPRVAQLELRNVKTAEMTTADDPTKVLEMRRSARDAFVVAWGLSALLVSAAFVLTSVPVGLVTGRYLIGVLIAAAALMPLLARRREIIGLVVAAASVYCVSGLLSIARGEASPSIGVTQAQADAFARLVRQEHVSHGYTDYWDAAPITWKSRFHVLAYPAEICGTGICRFPNSYDSAWYSPHDGERTFLITNTAKPQMGTPPPSLGPPAATFRVGTSYAFLVYNYDIASRIAH